MGYIQFVNVNPHISELWPKDFTVTELLELCQTEMSVNETTETLLFNPLTSGLSLTDHVKIDVNIQTVT